MYLSRLELLPEASQNPAFWADLRDVYREHQAIWQLLADKPDRKRDFLFRREGSGAQTRWFVLSEREPVDTRGMWKVEPKPFDPKLEPGDRLEFAVRVNPTVAKTREGRSSARHDVIMDEKRRLAPEERRKIGGDFIEDVGLAWLRKRAEPNGFRFEPEVVRIDGYRQHGGPREKEIRFSTLEIAGILAVADPARFREMLFKGLGPAKSFGCGLMLVRRA